MDTIFLYALDVSALEADSAVWAAFVSEDRRGVGLLLEEGIDWNITFTAMQVQE